MPELRVERAPRARVREVDLTEGMRAPFAASSAAAARRELCAALAAHHVPGPVTEDAALVVSELVSNALRHARPLSSGTLRVEWGVAGDRLRVAVTDGGGPTEPRSREAHSTATNGRGLAIVESLADDWGVTHHPGETTVWASLLLRRSSSRGMRAAVSGGARRG